METVTFSKLLLEDLDRGNGTRELRLQDGSLHVLTQIPGQTNIVTSITLTSSNGASSLTGTFQTPAGARIHGVTAKVEVTFGNSNGLTTLHIGDALLADRWGNGIARTLNTETSSANFTDQDEPRVSANYAAIVTAAAGTFDAAGQIELQCHWSIVRHVSST